MLPRIGGRHIAHVRIVQNSDFRVNEEESSTEAGCAQCRGLVLVMQLLWSKA
jgi:hypothetical protein